MASSDAVPAASFAALANPPPLELLPLSLKPAAWANGELPAVPASPPPLLPLTIDPMLGMSPPASIAADAFWNAAWIADAPPAAPAAAPIVAFAEGLRRQ